MNLTDDWRRSLNWTAPPGPCTWYNNCPTCGELSRGSCFDFEKSWALHGRREDWCFFLHDSMTQLFKILNWNRPWSILLRPGTSKRQKHAKIVEVFWKRQEACSSRQEDRGARIILNALNSASILYLATFSVPNQYWNWTRPPNQFNIIYILYICVCVCPCAMQWKPFDPFETWRLLSVSVAATI